MLKGKAKYSTEGFTLIERLVAVPTDLSPEAARAKEEARSAATAKRSVRGFTLIELLVVIAIIAVLLSLLMPALSRGKYLAKNANCVSNLKQLAAGFILYAGDNDAWYPDVWPEYDGPGSWFTAAVTYGAQIHPEYLCSNGKDKRTVLREYVGTSLSILKCPLETPRMDRHNIDTSSYQSRMRSAYNMYAGGNTKYKHLYLQKRMRKVGDEFIPMRGTATGLSFYILASDILKWEGPTNLISTQRPYQGVYDESGQWINGPTGWRMWDTTTKTYANFALHDGSVRTYPDVRPDSYVAGHFVKAGQSNGLTAAGYYLPRNLGR